MNHRLAMYFETHSQPQPRSASLGTSVCVIGAVLLLLLLAYTTFGMELEPFWVLLAVPVALLSPIFVRKVPVLFLVATAYVGTFKTHGAVANGAVGIGIRMTDPTLVCVALLYVAVVLQVLLMAVAEEGHSLRQVFSAQKRGVTAFFILILVIAISYSYTPAPIIGRDKVLKLIAFDMPIFLAPLILVRTARDVRQLTLLSILGSLIVAGRTVYRVRHPTAATVLGEQDPTEIGEGLLTGVAALMALYYPFRENKLFRVALVGCIVVLACGTMSSLSRSAILSLLLVGTTSLMFLRRYPMAFSRGAILGVVMAVVVTASGVSLWLWHQPATHSKFAVKARELTQTFEGSLPGGTAGQRYSFSESAWQAFLSKPLLGWGAGGWSTLWHYDDERVLKYPHNFILEIAAEQGLLGLTALGLLLLAMLGACAKVIRAPDRRFVFIVPVVALSLLGNAVTGQVEARDMWLWCGTLFALAGVASASVETAEV